MNMLISVLGRRRRRCVLVLAVVSVALAGLAGGASAYGPGSLDATFGTGGQVLLGQFEHGSSDTACCVAAGTDGTLALAGPTQGGTPAGLALAMLGSGGRLDRAFGGTGTVVANANSSPPVVAMTRDSSGNLIVVGMINQTGVTCNGTGSQSSIAVERFTPGGQLDTSFDAGGHTPGVLVLPPFTPCFSGEQFEIDLPGGVALDGHGNIVISGLDNVVSTPARPPALAVARVTAAGVLDTPFNSGGPRPGEDLVTGSSFTTAPAVTIEPDNNYIVTAAGAGSGSGVARLTSSGSLDHSFNSSGFELLPATRPGSDEIAKAVAVQPGDDAILLAETVGVSGTSYFGLVRLRSSGALDTWFAAGGPTPGELVLDHFAASTHEAVAGLARQADGATLLAGTATVSGNGRFAAARVTPAGALDTTYGTGGEVVLPAFQAGSVDTVHGAAAQPSDGSLVLAGASSVTGISRFAIARLTATGTTGGGGTQTKVVGKPKLSHLSLTGVAKGKPKLSFTLVAGSNEPALKEIAVGARGGLSFSKHKRNLIKGITVKRPNGEGVKFTATVARGVLTIMLSSAANSVKVTITGRELAATKALTRKVIHKHASKLKFTIGATDTQHITNELTLKVRA